MIATEPLLDTYVQEVRAALAANAPLEPTLARISEALRPLLADRGWLAARGLPKAGEPRYYLLYEDPDYGFVVTYMHHAAGHRGWIHDHGSMWTVYGACEGHEAIYRYERVDDGSREGYAEIRPSVRLDAGPGAVDYVLPYAIHNEVNESDAPSFALIIRSENGGRVLQSHFDPDARTVWQGPGLPATPEGNLTSRRGGRPRQGADLQS
jgi:predicted metal-dependent enzyme (double-stranded beta helix superfamily)